MKRVTLWIAVLLLGFGILHAATATGNGFKFPEWFVLVMNVIVVPFVVQWVKKITQVREIRAIIAAAFSFVTAIVGVLLAGQWSFVNVISLFVLAYAVAQIAYNLWWHAILQGDNK